MKNVIILFFLLVGCTFGRPQQQQQGQQRALSQVQQIIASRLERTPFRLSPGLNQLSNRLYAEVAGSGQGNVALSPFSVHTALSMTYFGSPERSETHLELTELLGLPVDFYADYAYNYLRMLLRYDNLRRELQTDVQFANKLFADDTFELKQAFNELLEIFFLTQAETVDFGRPEEAAATINDFVETKTQGLIKDLISKEAINDNTRLVIVNAIYFKATWLNRFDERATRSAAWRIPGSDETSLVRPTMVTSADVGVANVPELKATVLELPYVDEEFRMLIILPNEGVDVRTVDSRMGSGRFNLANLDKRLVYQDTQIRLPKFTAELSTSLKSALSSLGVHTLFTPGLANLTDISPSNDELYVSDVAHQAKVIVNEDGAEAAAATAVLVGTRGVMSARRRVFKADRPFIFMIQDTRLDVPLFVGRIVDPEGQVELPEQVFGEEENERRSAALIRAPADDDAVVIGERSQDVFPEAGFVSAAQEQPLPDCDEVLGFMNVGDSDSVSFPCRNKDGDHVVIDA